MLSVPVVAHPQEKKIFTSRDLRRVTTCLIRIISCGSNNITLRLYQLIGTHLTSVPSGGVPGGSASSPSFSSSHLITP